MSFKHDNNDQLRRLLDEIGNPAVPSDLRQKLGKSALRLAQSTPRPPVATYLFDFRVLVPVTMCALLFVFVSQHDLGNAGYELSADEIDELSEALGVTEFRDREIDYDLRQDELEILSAEISRL